MHIPLCIFVLIVLVAIIIYVHQEPFSATNYGAIGDSVRDMIGNNLNIIQYRAKYGNTVSPLKLSYIITAYKNGEMTEQKIKSIMDM